MSISQITSKSITDSTITSDDIATGAVESSMTTQIGGRRNLIINGAMQVAQRGTSFTKSGSSDVYILDRFYQVSNASAATVVYSQDTEAPANFKNSLKFSVTTADTDLANQRCHISQFIEGQNVAHLNWGTADAQDVTLSFWVRSSVTGTFGGSFVNSANDYSYPFTYTISSANTWEYKTVTVTGPTAGTWLDTNGIGIKIHWSMGTGSYRLGTAGAWSANRYEGATGQVDPISTTGATWYITGVQLEVGTVATPFEHISYGEQLALCQRYYQTSYADGTAAGTVTDTNRQLFWNMGTDTYVQTQVYFMTRMRASPSTVVYSNATGASNKVRSSGVDKAAGTQENSQNMFQIYITDSVNDTSNINYHWTAESEL